MARQRSSDAVTFKQMAPHGTFRATIAGRFMIHIRRITAAEQGPTLGQLGPFRGDVGNANIS
jgi:hypothetical protein